ncbi:MFS transporter [Curtobacterium ammoniigenes]|uniref:MFS transporter n=1 Tax=Curtobacterium ammoniigenes TaxID=395387 RepID=UPI000830A526|nr:MFS transporter [Curtobacterium ammoniigenes]
MASAAGFLTTMAAAGAPSVLLARYQSFWHFRDSALTVAFAIYALVLVGALLVFGSASDRLGRRPVAIGSLALTAGAMVLFLTAHGVGSLIVARGVQGAATGAATTVFSASVVELAPARLRRVAEVLVSITTAGGLGIGIVLAGVAVRFAARPSVVVFGSSLVVVVVAAALLLAAPETARGRDEVRVRQSGPLGIHVSVGGALARLMPGVAGIWMSAGLILGLGSSLVSARLHITDSVTGSWIVAAQPLTATIFMILIAPRIAARHALPLGLVATLIGVSTEGTAFISGIPTLVIVGAVITGVGFGAVFSGVLRYLLPGIRDDERASFFAIFYLVGYVAYGGSVIAAGFVGDLIGLAASASLYAAATIIVVAIALPLSRTLQARSPHPRGRARDFD